MSLHAMAHSTYICFILCVCVRFILILSMRFYLIIIVAVRGKNEGEHVIYLLVALLINVQVGDVFCNNALINVLGHLSLSYKFYAWLQKFLIYSYFI